MIKKRKTYFKDNHTHLPSSLRVFAQPWYSDTDKHDSGSKLLCASWSDITVTAVGPEAFSFLSLSLSFFYHFVFTGGFAEQASNVHSLRPGLVPLCGEWAQQLSAD